MPPLAPGTKKLGHALSIAWQEAGVVVSVVVPPVLESDSSARVIALQLGMAPSS
jgi:hypothetical protein